MLLQGFPSSYTLLGTLSDQVRLVSDAVPPPVAKALAESILEVIQHGKQLTRREPLLFSVSGQAGA
jgi:DNA (cytosine-5)-methyltransferase 1